MSIIKTLTVPSLQKQGRNDKKNITINKFILLTAFSIAGFAVAILANIFVRQVADVKITKYAFGSTIISINDAYRIVVGLIILLYLGISMYSFFNEDRRIKFVKRAPFRFAIGSALALWDILGTKLLILPQPFFPGPARIIESFLMEGDYIWDNTLYSLRLFAVGFILGVVFGVGTGILIGWFPKVHYWVYPILKITGVIPAVAWMPFAYTLLPNPFSAASFLIVICAWFSIASLTAQGIQSTPRAQFEVARTLGAKTPFLVFHVAIPHALPQIFSGIANANGFAFTTLVMAEMLGQPGGLGYYINASKVWSAYYKVFAAIVVMAVLFSLIMEGIGLIQRHVLRWQKGLVKSSDQ